MASKKIYLLIQGLTLFLVGFLLLDILKKTLSIPDYILPSGSSVLGALEGHFTEILGQSLTTLTEALAGLVLGFFSAVFIGGIFVYNPIIKSLFYPLIFIFQVIPLVVIMPLFIIWFGFSVFTKIILVAIFSLFPMLVNFLEQASQIDSSILSWMKLIRFSRWQIFKEAILKYCFYGLFSGLKIATTYALSTAIIAELFGSSKGLGVFLTASLASLNTPLLFATVLFIIFLSIGLYFCVILLQKIFLKNIYYH